MKMINFIILALALFLGSEAQSKDYQIAELLQIAEQNSLVQAAEFTALAQQRTANQQKYWDNPVLIKKLAKTLMALPKLCLFIINYPANIILKPPNIIFLLPVKII
jgi:hypothetical protein